MTSSPTRTRTLNLAVNSRSLYRLSYRGISSSSIPARSAPLKGTRLRERAEARESRADWTSKTPAEPEREARRTPRPRLRPEPSGKSGRLTPCAPTSRAPRWLFREYPRSARSSDALSSLAQLANCSCKHGRHANLKMDHGFRHGSISSNSERDPDQDSVCRVPAQLRASRANRGMHLYCTRSPA